MLDISFIRDNLELVKAGAAKKHVTLDLDDLIAHDDARRAILSELEGKRAQQNQASTAIAQEQDSTKRQALIDSMKSVKEDVQALEEKLRETMKAWQKLMLQVPQIPDMSVPDGKSDAENVEVHTWGEAQPFAFASKDHVELMKQHNMVDFDRGSKVHGFRGYYLKGDGAMLSWAIWNYANAFFTKRGFMPVLPPAIVRTPNLYGTGHLPNDVDDIYKTQDDDYLIGTAEVSLMGYYADDIIDQTEFPIKMLGFSPCFRREAGSYSKDVKGLIRVHEFYKLEQVMLCEASHAESVKWHEWINRNTEEFIESLGIPYRTVLNCGGDLGLGQVKKYDIELWVPGEEKYREISSASYFHDFQTRRFNIRYRDVQGTLRYAHSLNCTAVPTPRILVSLIENFQQADGTIKIPEVLQPYFGKLKIG
ncbi:serine--tRNA ligase [Candidatus Kaiserbacteria bacterium RIFCSPHIGHO2_02_FULL_50_50]|uniref:Serine--tRNA ligase n=1 Tax=Candidatus Kaiserbacteria bacterium RIFCSPHIGHO2_02_FULL_50_50 TaxID=1798492 RepID=A0A1F6DG97_9BACT|nr:MAG: serine--tRNA ligase [Candidatus Kaiserbacteria bacterium RIFCSPHIGHO2_02_FULL_50_50]OGG88391.1 MAG: serine--tRNA ligase [Candidatus Kaiserbacteria bacterium RIFCSPLOWO2_12_FULL_50_10]